MARAMTVGLPVWNMRHKFHELRDKGVLTMPVEFNFDPPADLGLNSFQAAMGMLPRGDSYVLGCHEVCSDVAEAIKKYLPNIPLRLIMWTGDNRASWFVKSFSNGSHPPVRGTVHSRIADA